ncbi:MAG: bifunctional 23S rRNA (guanine(2069)-N(7))-methyltransferase RlmK/23S rRNA (guanine(2445)-N(2))-methyltransferase RlmL [Sandaracinaceae bacterium]|nr:bifunctional 23S rRNA (guanine(2069)-N(7))-methyltransferase RlmK/23S rRNA (guanine(2445)-N(2))-methyltransferase RlmL [Sandaracinaceae bacterium]
MDFIATCARGTEDVLAQELRRERVRGVEPGMGVVRFAGTLEDAYTACMWSRVASKVLLPIAEFPVRDADPDALYEGVSQVAWLDHLGPEQTLAVDCVVSGDRKAHTRYLALRTKDAIVDQLRARTGSRPNVDTDAPDVRVHVHLGDGIASVAIDLAGEPLHRRHYRPRGARAPLKENLAAALLMMADWSAERGVLLDPMCGSGTWLIEAARMTADIAPALDRQRFGFTGWRGHQEDIFRRVHAEAQARARGGRENGKAPPVIVGSDVDEDAVTLARKGASLAGVERLVRFERRAMKDARPPREWSERPEGSARGLLIVNPPYGERLGEGVALYQLYEELGDTFKQHFGGFDAWVLAGNATLVKRVGLKAKRRIPVWNGPIECRFLQYPLVARRVRPESVTPEASAGSSAPADGSATGINAGLAASASTSPAGSPAAARRPVSGSGEGGPAWRKPSAEAVMFENRLRKNLRTVPKWAEKQGLGCYRVYDADIPEYNVAVDVFRTERGPAALVHEYGAPRHVSEADAERRLRDAMMVVPKELDIDPERVHLRVRQRSRADQARRGAPGQYERRAPAREIIEVVEEQGLRFEINFGQYLDCGLFMDLRTLRNTLRDECRGQYVLNLFAYTCTASVYAAAGAAREVVSVDLNSNYLDWGVRNFELNRIPTRGHLFERADCLRWLSGARGRFDRILLNPPSYSRSKSMRGDFDVTRDYPGLIADAAARLAPGGALYFVTHARGFQLDPAKLPGLVVKDIVSETLPKDFARSPHHAFRITR